jgi:hypothetical protein
VLIPAEALNDDGMFVDDVALATLREIFADTLIVPGHELTQALQNCGGWAACDTVYRQ